MITIRLRLILSIILSSALIICLSGCNNNQTFSGSKTSNDDQFLVDFDALNSTVNSQMLLLEGEKIKTTIVINKGDVDIVVENEFGKVAYRGNKVESCTFIIEIEEAGTYTFYITGAKAKGSVYFTKS